ncbi:hypothetical protein MW335_003306 [Acinetobacter baumannii]|nr:hypothetical protein [Acinetobacter sp. AOR41_HL]EJB8413042.1 hypothetical protein [Acinetobacter baumannii]MDA3463497.1 hypothetical protein [Acinetobacter sp. AOR41_HL]
MSEELSTEDVNVSEVKAEETLMSENISKDSSEYILEMRKNLIFIE